MNRILILLFVALLSLSAGAQTRLSAAQQKQIVAKIDRAASSMKSMTCTFTQTKKMKMMSRQLNSKGVMYFRKPSQLRWQYTSPYTYTFVLNGSQVIMSSSKGIQRVDVKKNKMFREISEIIVNSITGGNLQSNSAFSFALYREGNIVFARLLPKKKELKQIYRAIDIYFTPSLSMVSAVEMTEKSGDVTTVSLCNVKINPTINDKVFNLK